MKTKINKNLKLMRDLALKMKTWISWPCPFMTFRAYKAFLPKKSCPSKLLHMSWQSQTSKSSRTQSQSASSISLNKWPIKFLFVVGYWKFNFLQKAQIKLEHIMPTYYFIYIFLSHLCLSRKELPIQNYEFF